jgi:hypothetical protein
MDAQYTCDVAFEDGTQQTLDVTNAVNAGISPSALWAQSSLSYFNGTVPMYCGDTEIATSETDDTPITQNVLVGLKGDVNLDGVVSIEDASTILRYYASVAAGLDVSLTDDPESPEETLAYFLGDIDTQSQTKENGGSLSIDDASAILKYYASTAAGITLSWDEFL